MEKENSFTFRWGSPREVARSQTLFGAVFCGDLQRIDRVMDADGFDESMMYVSTVYATPHSNMELAYSALHFAAEIGDREVVDHLIRVRGCDPLSHVDDFSVDATPLLHVAVRGGQIDMIRHLMDAYGMSLESEDTQGATPIFYVRDVETLDFLVSRGADVSALDWDGMTPLFYTPLDPVRQRLVEMGVDPEHRDSAGEAYRDMRNM